MSQFAEYQKQAKELIKQPVTMMISSGALAVTEIELMRFVTSRETCVSLKGKHLTQARIDKEKLVIDKDYRRVPEKKDMVLVEAANQLTGTDANFDDLEALVEITVDMPKLECIIEQLDRSITSTSVLKDHKGIEVTRSQVQFLEEGKDYRRHVTRPDLAEALHQLIIGMEKHFEKIEQELIGLEELKEPIYTGEKNVEAGNQSGIIE